MWYRGQDQAPAKFGEFDGGTFSSADRQKCRVGRVACGPDRRPGARRQRAAAEAAPPAYNYRIHRPATDRASDFAAGVDGARAGTGTGTPSPGAESDLQSVRGIAGKIEPVERAQARAKS